MWMDWRWVYNSVCPAGGFSSYTRGREKKKPYPSLQTGSRHWTRAFSCLGVLTTWEAKVRPRCHAMISLELERCRPPLLLVASHHTHPISSADVLFVSWGPGMHTCACTQGRCLEEWLDGVLGVSSETLRIRIPNDSTEGNSQASPRLREKRLCPRQSNEKASDL